MTGISSEHSYTSHLIYDLLTIGALSSAVIYKWRSTRFVPHTICSSFLAVTSIVLASRSPSPILNGILRMQLFIVIGDLAMHLSRRTQWADIIQWTPVGAIISSLLVSFIFGRCTDGLLLFIKPGDASLWPYSLALSVLTVVALVCWSKYVKGKHGPIQGLEQIISPAKTLPLALANAFTEEYEFRVMLQSALTRPGLPTDLLSCLTGRSLYALVLSNVCFAALHVRGGFPRGAVGGVLVFFWGMALGVLRCVSGGMLQSYLVHVIADTAIFCIIYAHRSDPNQLRSKQS